MSFPPFASDPLIQVERVGEASVRAGQMHEYGIRVTNVSDHPVNGVVVHEWIGGDFVVQASSIPHETSAQRTPGRQSQQDRQAVQRRQQQTSAQEQQSSAQQQQAQTGQQQANQLQRNQRQPDQQQQQQQQGAQQRQADQQQGQTYTWRLGTLAPGESKTLQVRGIAGAEGTINTCVSLEYQTALCATLQVVKPDLAIEQRVVIEGEPSDRALICEELGATWLVRNTGSARLESPVLRVELPDGLTTAEGQPTAEAQLEPLDPGQTVERGMRLRATAPGEFVIQGVATSGEVSAHAAPERVTVVQPQLELSVQAPDTSYVGRALSYGIRVTNTGDVVVPQVALLFDPPEKVERIGLSARFEREGERLILGDLQPGEEIYFTATMDTVAPGELQGRFVAEGYCVEAIERTVATSIVGIPAVRLETVDLQDPVRVGDTTTYEVQVKNQGSAEDLNIRLTGELPQGLTFVEASGDTQVQGQGRQVTFSPVERLAPGALATWRVQARGENAGQGIFTLELTSDAVQQPIIEQEPTTIVQ